MPYRPDGTGRRADIQRPHGPPDFTDYARVNTLGDVNQQTAPLVPPIPPHRFTVPLSATRRGARLARVLAAEQLCAWGLPPDPARLVVAELAANAVLHGQVPGRDFRLTLLVTRSGTLRIEVVDLSGDRLPARSAAADAALAESGYGLLLVEESADRWGVRTGPGPGKAVWAEIDYPGHVARARPEADRASANAPVGRA